MNEKSIINQSNTQNQSSVSENNSPSTTYFQEKMHCESLEELNCILLNGICLKDETIFKKTIDKLNEKFYSETKRFLTIKTDFEKSQDNLFCILFKQISHYIEEIDKLNIRLKEKDENIKIHKTKIDEVFIV